jgi:hypothetical protein
MDWFDILGTIGGGVFSGYMANQASNAQEAAAKQANLYSANAANKSIQSQERMFDKTAAMSTPWRAIGERSLNELYYQMTGQAPSKGFKPADGGPSGEIQPFEFEADPGYQFRMDQGIQAVNRGASAAGQLDSGARNKDLIRFGQGLGSDEYGRAYNRWESQRNFDYNDRQNYLNRLAAMSGTGQTAAAQTGQAASVTGSGMANTYMNFGNAASNNANALGNAQASGYINTANAGNNMLNNLVGLNMLK